MATKSTTKIDPSDEPNLLPMPRPGVSNALALPADLANELMQQAKDAAAKERPSVARISLRSGVMTYQGQPLKDNKLPCVVLCAVHRNAYYDKPFDPNNLQNPVCFAVAEDDEHMQAHENVPDANVGPNSSIKGREGPRDCEGCKFNDWASDPRPGSRGKACKETRRLTILPLSAVTSADEIYKGELAIMDIPVTSVQNFRNYVNTVASVANVPIWCVATEIEVLRDPKTQFKVEFEPTGMIHLSEEIIEALTVRRAEAIKLALTPFDEVASTAAGTMTKAPTAASKF